MIRKIFSLTVFILMITVACNTGEQKVKVKQQQNEAKTEKVENESSKAEDTWPKSAKLAYIDRCTESINLQGLSMKNAEAYCTCTTNEMEAEFGMKEYDQMMKAEANPNGSIYDKRLYDVLMTCSDHLPK